MERLWITLVAFICMIIALFTGKVSYADAEDARIRGSELTVQRMEEQKRAEKQALERSPAMQKRIEQMKLPAYKMDGSQYEPEETAKEDKK